MICDTCKHKDICKWVKTAETIEKDLKRLSDPDDKATPIVIERRCIKYESIKAVREGVALYGDNEVIYMK